MGCAFDLALGSLYFIFFHHENRLRLVLCIFESIIEDILGVQVTNVLSNSIVYQQWWLKPDTIGFPHALVMIYRSEYRIVLETI